MPRQARLDTPGTLHRLITRGIEKRRIVDDTKDQENFISRLGRSNASLARAKAAHILIEDFGITLAEVARNLGVTTSAIFNILKRKNDKFN